MGLEVRWVVAPRSGPPPAAVGARRGTGPGWVRAGCAGTTGGSWLLRACRGTGSDAVPDSVGDGPLTRHGPDGLNQAIRERARAARRLRARRSSSLIPPQTPA